MTTRAGTEYLNRVKNVQKYSSQFGEPKHDPGVSSGTTAANLRAKLKRLTKAQLIEKLLFHMNNDEQNSYVQNNTISNSSISLPAASASSNANHKTSNATIIRSCRATLSGILIDNIVSVIVEYLPGQSIHRLKCVSRELHKRFGTFASANFHRFRDQFSLAKYFNSLCSSGASLVEVTLDTSDFKTMVPETLLQQCRCDNLRSFKLWYRDDLLVPIRNCTVNIETDEILDSKGKVMNDEDFRLAVSPPCGKNVLQLLTEKCADTLTELRIGLKGYSDRYSKSNLLPSSIICLKNLISLEISMGCPLEVLDAVAKLRKLRRFSWLNSDNTKVYYHPIDSVNYIIRSDSLEFVKLAIGKGTLLAGIECPNLRNVELLLNSGGFCEFRFLRWLEGFNCMNIDWFVGFRATVTNYVLADTGYIPLQLAKDCDQAIYGYHFIQVNPTEVGGEVSWLKVFTKIQFPVGCTVKSR